MVTRTRRGRQKASLGGWWVWLPFVVLPFGVFLFETWLQTEKLYNGYELNDLNQLIGQTRDRLDGLEDFEASLEAMERIHVKALELGLRTPTTRETEVIQEPPRRKPIKKEEVFAGDKPYSNIDLARLDEDEDVPPVPDMDFLSIEDSLVSLR